MRSNFFSDPARLPWLALGFSLAALAAAHASEHLGNLSPCQLCLYQRGAFWAVAGISIAALLAQKSFPQFEKIFIALIGLGFLVSLGIAFFHVGVEQKWWTGSESCSGPALDAITDIEELRRRITGAPVSRCNEIQWSLFGISIAGYNVMASAFAAVFSLRFLKK